MISIDFTTTLDPNQVNNLITLVFFLVIFSLRNILAGLTPDSPRRRILLENLNLVSAPLLIVVIVVLIHNIWF